MSWQPFDDDAEKDPSDVPEPEGFDGIAGFDEDTLEAPSGRWPLDSRDLFPRERWMWFEQLWTDACMLQRRYRLGLRAGWWEDQFQVEMLAALAAWVDRYDSGEWDDPPGKLALLYDLERINELLRDGFDPFRPERDRPAFLRHLIEVGCEPPPGPSGGALSF